MKNFIKNTIQSQKVFYRYFRRKGWRRFFKENILETDGSNRTKALSIALGIFIGFSPIWGFHTIAVLFLATFFRLNKLIAFMSTQITAPPLIPFVLAISMFIGAPFVQNNHFSFSKEIDFEFVKNNLIQYLIGSMILATSMSAIVGFTSYFLFEKWTPTKNSSEKI